MSKHRMAGEELEKDNPVAAEAKATVKDKSNNRSLEERFGKEYVDRVSADGLQDATNNGRYSKKELLAEVRNGNGDGDDFKEKYQGLVDGGATFNNKAQAFLEGRGITFGGGGDDKPDTTPVDETPEPEVSIPTPTPETPKTPKPGLTPGITGPGFGQVVNQDNDVNSNVTGDGNTVNINQDNSVRQNAGLAATNLMDNYVLTLRKAKTTI